MDLFWWIHRDLAHPWLDTVMRFLSGNPVFAPALVVVAAGLLWRGGWRGWVFVLMTGIAVGLANEFVAEPIKDHARRLRPWAALDGVTMRAGSGNRHGSMPSAHAVNCAVMAVMSTWYYRRSGWVVIPLAGLVGLSRVYNGSHFPTDVLAGGLLGAGFAWGWIQVAGAAWERWMPRWAPWIAARCPSIRQPGGMVPRVATVPSAQGEDDVK